ncbi:MAG: hypothetical protein P4M11_04465 [Candidatus Pacebacteria bacterium]|nr:hypothetical protein [Candidatus Paceibacterota bacterium]
MCLAPGYTYMKEQIFARLTERNDVLAAGFKGGLIGYIVVMVMCFALGWMPYIIGKKKQVSDTLLMCAL